jgi:hypothetical protein
VSVCPSSKWKRAWCWLLFYMMACWVSKDNFGVRRSGLLPIWGRVPERSEW